MAFWVGLFGSLASITTFVAAEIAGRPIGEVLIRPVDTPLWVELLAAPVLVALGAALKGFSLAKRDLHQREQSPDFLTADSPQKISSEEESTPAPFSSDYLRGIEGTLGVWLYLHPFGQGIRELENNRYIFAHDTNGGDVLELNGKRRYVNVFSLSRGPRSSYRPPSRPVWRVWLANGTGKGKSWKLPDSNTDLAPGWHHFAVRWNHRGPLLQLLIDGRSRLSTASYLDYWPDEFADTAFLGCWQSLARVHFIETLTSRFIASTYFLDDAWFKDEALGFRPSAVPE